MDASARRVKAERNRRRLPQRGGVSRWARRTAGLLGTAALLGVGVVSAQMIMPDRGGQDPVIAAAPAATPGKEKAKKSAKKTRKPKGLTKAQKAAREAAVAEV